MNNRIKTISIFISIFFLILLSRLFYWQIIKGQEIKEKSTKQNYKLTKTIPQRGKILTSDNFPIVSNQINYQLSIYKPNLKEDLNQIFTKIGQINPEFILTNQKLIDDFKNKPNQKWLTFPTLFREEDIEKLNFPGLIFDRIDNRFYPENDLGKNIFGIIGKNIEGDRLGYGGLEAYYNKQLQGKPGYSWTSKDATGQTVLSKKGWQKPSVDGRNLVTSINRSIQSQAENVLKDGIEKFSADSGSISIIEPKTGAIIAMISLVSTSSATRSAQHNAVIADLFEPGSVFKPLIVSMALEKKSIDTNFICEKCNQSRTIGQYTITNWDNETHPNSSLQDIIKNSDNIGMSYIISRLGLTNFQDFYNKLGLNQKTGIDLQGEAKALTKNSWAEIDLATASFGQGIAVTQLKMLQLFNAIANDGFLVQPKIVNYMEENGKKIYSKNKEPIRVFSADTTQKIKNILKYSVENGVVSKFKSDNIEVCAKSGTAQVAVKGGYENSQTIASYIGFSPCQNPKYTMIITIYNPRTSPWGSSTAAPLWFDLAKIIPNLL